MPATDPSVGVGRRTSPSVLDLIATTVAYFVVIAVGFGVQFTTIANATGPDYFVAAATSAGAAVATLAFVAWRAWAVRHPGFWITLSMLGVMGLAALGFALWRMADLLGSIC